MPVQGTESAIELVASPLSEFRPIPNNRLNISNCALFKGSFYRRNLSFATDHALATLQQLYNLGVQLIFSGRIQEIDPLTLTARNTKQKIPTLNLTALGEDPALLISRNTEGVAECLMHVYSELPNHLDQDVGVKQPIQLLLGWFIPRYQQQ